MDFFTLGIWSAIVLTICLFIGMGIYFARNDNEVSPDQSLPKSGEGGSMKKEKPPWDPKTHRLTLGTVGLVTPEEVQHATEVFRQLTEEIEALRKRNPHPTYAQMRAVMEKYPPEAKAIILLKTLETMGTWLKPWCEWETHLVLLVDQEDEKAIRETIANAYETALFPIRIIGRKLVSQVRARAEAGWPEWDMAKPQVVEEKSNDWGIDSFLASVLEAGDYDEEDKS